MPGTQALQHWSHHFEGVLKCYLHETLTTINKLLQAEAHRPVKVDENDVCHPAGPGAPRKSSSPEWGDEEVR